MNYNFEKLNGKPVSTPEAYAQSFKHKEPVVVTGLCGRILRGKSPLDFTTLTDDPKRKIVMLMGPDGLSLLSGKESYDMLTSIGYTHSYIAQKISEGTQFKLAIFPESQDAKPATWTNMVDLVSRAYPEVSRSLDRHHRQLANSVYLKDLFSGDGYTYTPDGQRGMQEYATLNKPINSLGNSILLDILF